MARTLRLVLFALIGIGFAAAAPIALAQSAAPITKPACKKPEFPGRLASESQRKSFNKDIEAFADCMKKYMAEQQKLADEHIKAANAAAADYNQTVKDLQAEIDKGKE